MIAKSLEILNYLQNKDDWTTSSQLSLKLGVSLPSIKNYISEIKKTNTNLIISSRNGYKVNKIELQHFLKNIRSEVPQEPEERIDYIIMKLVKTSEKYIHIYDCAVNISYKIKTRINCAILFPQYYNLDIKLAENLCAMSCSYKAI